MRSALSWPGNVRADRLVVAAVVATLAFVVYTRTLLPGVDLGDTGAFQAAVLWPKTSARQAYPLYYGLAAPFVSSVSAGSPARGLNLFSAVAAAAAVGLLTWRPRRSPAPSSAASLPRSCSHSRTPSGRRQ